MGSRYIIVQEFTSEVDAEVARGLLEANNISSQITKDDVGGMRPHLQLTSGVFLSVPFEQQTKAKEILDSKLELTNQNDESSFTWTCTNCGEKHEEQFSSCWNCGSLQ